MEKNKDLDQLKEQVLKFTRPELERTWDERRMIVDAHFSNGIPISHLSKKFGVSRQCIYKWIRTFADGKVPERSNRAVPDVKQNPSSMSKRSQKPVGTEADELARLREENKRLAEALKMSEWMNHAKDVMIDEAEKMFNIPIRKKSGAKQ